MRIMPIPPRRYFNPRPPCGGRRPLYIYNSNTNYISIHAPRAGGDTVFGRTIYVRKKFQSTPPVRGATGRGSTGTALRQNFNPRPPCGGRQRRPEPEAALPWISIHAPRAGGDQARRIGSALGATEFQSTPPVRGATKSSWCSCRRSTISIHAPRAGGDQERRHEGRKGHRFQSTPPVRGATASAPHSTSTPRRFQSTPPVRGATYLDYPLGGGDEYFNPRPPCGGRPGSGL